MKFHKLDIYIIAALQQFSMSNGSTAKTMAKMEKDHNFVKLI